MKLCKKCKQKKSNVKLRNHVEVIMDNTQGSVAELWDKSDEYISDKLDESEWMIGLYRTAINNDVLLSNVIKLAHTPYGINSLCRRINAKSPKM